MNQIHFLHAPHVEDPPDAMLDPRLLRSFVGIIDAQSFTAAADRLSMTQSTISQQLARLEEQVGSALVDRTARPIVATAAGERLLAYARRILALQQEAQAALGDPAGTAPLRIGVPRTWSTRRWPRPSVIFRGAIGKSTWT